MKSRNIFFILYLLGAIIGASWLFYNHKNLPDVAENDQKINELLLKTQSDNAAVNEAVLRSRENLDVSYDYLTKQTRLLQEDISALISINNILDYPEAITAKNNFKRSITNKLENIERFKSHNAILKNALRYAPEVGLELSNLADQVSLPKLALLYSKTVNHMQKYVATGDRKDKEIFKKLIADIDQQTSNIPKNIFNKQVEFILHTNTVLQELDQVKVLVNLIIADQQKELGDLSNAWVRWTNFQQEKIDRYNLYMTIYIVYLVLGLLILTFWLRSIYFSLDKKVVERTKELEGAYSELQNSQVKLVQSEKMALLGQMIAGVAHEVNTPLGYVKNNVTLIRDLFNEYDDIINSALTLEPNVNDNFQQVKIIHKKASEIEDDGIRAEQKQLFEDTLFGIEQIAELVVNLKNFARLDEDKIKHIDVRDCIDSSLNIAKNHVKHFNIEKRYKSKNLPLVACSPAQINQVLLNLFNNAVQAMDEATGKLIIDVGITEQSIYIDVIDNGHGMDEETKAKIFTPFFTTKSAGQGTGLGLAICQQIMESHGGKIQVDSRIGKGTVFRIFLPLVSPVKRTEKTE